MTAGASNGLLRWMVRLLCLGLCAATLAPAAQNLADKARDGFPFSWYPMFHKPRPALERRTYIVGLDAAGERSKIPYTHWARGGYNIGASHVNALVSGSQADRDTFCARVAESVARSKKKDMRAVSKLQMESGDFSLPSYFGVGLRRPMRYVVLATCPVVREDT